MAQLTAQFFQTILKIEGGFQNMPSDSGNYCNGQLVGTNYGMSAVAVATWWGRCPTEQEMRNLTLNDAWAFYGWYFHRYNLFQIENQQFFELLANNAMGSPANAAKVAQRALNKLGYSVSVDGVYGPQTIGALNDAWKRFGPKIYNTVREDWVAYLKSLSHLPQFIDGWMNRMNKHFPLLAIPAQATTGISLGLALLVLAVGYKFFKKAA